jgi:hypothetical protein
MKKTHLFVIVLILFCACKKTTSRLIPGRWNIEKMYEAGTLESSYSYTQQEANTVFYSNRFIFHKDGTFDITLFQTYLHGVWTYNEAEKILQITADNSNKTFTCVVDTIGIGNLVITPEKAFLKKVQLVSDSALYNSANIDINLQHTFVLTTAKESYYKKEKDPYNVINNAWRIKPLQAETNPQIHARALNHLQFLQLIFKDALEKEREAVVYNWFTTPFTIANNGVALKFYQEIKDSWEKNFYDSTEAKEGYEMLRKCFSHKIKFMQTENKFLKKVDMFDQMINNMNQN